MDRIAEEPIMIRKSVGRLRRPPRRGITLIEVLILVTCTAVMLGLCAVTIQVMLRLFNDSEARLVSSVTIERLARQLREDAHSSASAAMEAVVAGKPGRRATLALGLEAGHAITYKMLESAIDRDETLGGKRIRHESYSLPRGREARFELGEEGGHTTVALLVTHSPGASHTETARPLEVVAVVGKRRPVLKPKPEERKQ
jgi:hypothetical protein